MRMKYLLPVCFLLVTGIPVVSESFEAATISTEVSPEELQRLYGKRTKFVVDEFNYRYLNTIKGAYRNTLYRDNRKTREEREASLQDLKTLLEPEDNRFYGVLVRSYIQFTEEELDCSIEIMANDQQVAGKQYLFPVQMGSDQMYFFVYKLDEPREGKDLTLIFTYPDSRKQILRLP